MTSGDEIPRHREQQSTDANQQMGRSLQPAPRASYPPINWWLLYEAFLGGMLVGALMVLLLEPAAR
jgi:hypothetical protein